MPLTETELKKIKQEAISYCNKNHSGSDKVYKAAYEAHIAAVTKERERAKVLIDSLNEWATAINEFDSGYSNKSGIMTPMNIAALSSAMQGAELKLYRTFKQYNQ